MKNFSFFWIVIFLVLTFQVSAQKVRKDSVLLYESFESSSATAKYWTATASSGCSSYNWQIVSTSGGGAYSTDKYMSYPASSATKSCNATLTSPKLAPGTTGNDDSLEVDFSMFRESVSTTDFLGVYIKDENGNTVVGPISIPVDESQSPSSTTGWDRLSWKMSYQNIASLSTSNFVVTFIGVSDHGADILLDEINIQHIYYQEVKNVKITSNFKGDTLTAGDKANISWTEQNVSSTNLSYSTDSGKNYTAIGTESSPYSWTVASKATNTAFIMVADASSSTVYDINGPFIIAWPEKLLNFNGGDSIPAGSTTKIYWRSRNTVTKVDLAVSIDGGFTYVTIATGVSSPANQNNSYAWTIPNVTSKTAKLKITGDDGSFIESAAYFKITHTSGIADANTPGDFSIYPNPVHDNLNLQFSNPVTENTYARIYDINGKLILNQIIPQGSSNASLNIAGFVKGVYILEVMNSQTVSKKEVVVY